MDQRISRAVALAAVVTLLAGCGSGSASGSATAPTLTQAPTLAQTGASTDADGPETGASAPPSSTADPAADRAAQTTQVKAVTEKFVTSVLTIGYPDTSFDVYLARIKPQMTKKGYSSLESAESTRKGTAALKSLYPQRARTAPKFSGDAVVTSLDATSASAQLDYENVAQRKDGDGWRTLKTVGTGSVTVKLVLEKGKWLVDKAS